jgi:putative MATE family efflux protein
MGHQPVGRLLVSFSLPALVGMVVNATYNIVDTAFVGRLGHEAIAGLTVVWPLQLIMIALSVGVGVGANSLIARRLGAGHQDQANHAGAQALLLAVVSGLLMMIAVLSFTDPILRLLGARHDVIPFSRTYITTIVWFAPLVFLPMTCNNLIRAEGNPVLSMVIMGTSALINIGLDPLFIFGIGPFPALGVRGAAVATVIARAAAVFLYLGYFASRLSGYRFRLRQFLPAPRIWASIYAVGLPSMAIQLSGSVVSGIANNIVGGFGSLALAAFGVMFRLFSFAFMPCLGITQGVLPLVGFNYGAHKLGRVREVIQKGALSATVITTAFTILFVAIPYVLVGLFNRDPEFIALAGRGMRITSFAFFGVGSAVVFTGFFQGIGKAFPAMFLSLTRQLIFYLPGILILPRLFGLDGFWTAIPLSDGMAVVASLIWTAWMSQKLGIPLFQRGTPPLPEPAPIP